MVFIWRGFGLIVPIVFGICAWIVSYWYEDTRLGNASFMGWALFYTSIVLLLPGLVFWGGTEDEDGTKRKHDFMFVPVIFWSLGLGALCTYVLLQRDPTPGEDADAVAPTEQVNLKEEKVVRTVNFLNSSTDSLELTVSDARGEIDRFYVGPKSWKPMGIDPHKYKIVSNDMAGKVVMTWENTIGPPTDNKIDYDAAWIQMDGGQHNLMLIDVTPMMPGDFKKSNLKDVDWLKYISQTYMARNGIMEPVLPNVHADSKVLEPGDLLPSSVGQDERVYALITVPANQKIDNDYLIERLGNLYFE